LIRNRRPISRFLNKLFDLTPNLVGFRLIFGVWDKEFHFYLGNGAARPIRQDPAGCLHKPLIGK
jgi:hypothetical protein